MHHVCGRAYAGVMTRESWDDWKVGWQHTFFAVVLGLTTLGAVTGVEGDARQISVRLALAAALGAWYAYWFVLRPDARRPYLPYLLGAAGQWAVMAAVDPALLWVGGAIVIPYCMRHVLWGAAGCVVALSAAWLWQGYVQDGALEWPRVIVCAVGVLVLAVFAGYIAMLDREGSKRQRLLDELAAAQAELAASERQAGILAERQRLARDIHDTLTQGFASISMLLDAALADMPPDGPATVRVDRAMRTARENLAESRRLVDALRPLQLEGARLPDAVGRLTSRLCDENGIAAETVVTGDPADLGVAVETNLLRVVQEALTNVRRHAAAREVTVTITYLDDLVVIDVQDDGAGFVAGSSTAGVGLNAMRERMAGLGGEFTLESAPGQGTTVAVSVPVSMSPGLVGEPAGTSGAADPMPASP